MSPCRHHPCSGTVDETGFCDTCGRRPALAGPPPAAGLPRSASAPAPSGSALSGGISRIQSSRWTAGGMVPLPLLQFPEPRSRIQRDPEVEEHRRRCRRCHGAVGRSFAGQPGHATGFCPKDGTPFSFLPQLEPGSRVGRYEVEGCIKFGGFGWIYLAWHPDLETFVALKGMIDEDDAQLAVRERRHLISLDHPNIVRILDFVTHARERPDEATGYIVMEYVNGRSLREILDEARLTGTRPLPLEHVIAYGLEILAALEYLHSHGLLYCDMKPDNVMLTADRLKIIDLGGVRAIGDHDSPVVGTPGYQVEQAEIEARGLTVQSDLHTVGQTLRVLFGASSDSPARGDIRFGVESFNRLVERAVARQSDRRFRSAAEMAEQLRGVLREVVALRTGEERPEPSAVFAGTPALLDAGLGEVPPLERWTTASARETAARRDVLDDGRPDPASAAAGLAVPRADPNDPAAGFLAEVDALDAGRRIDRIRTHRAASGPSVEIELCACRTHLVLSEVGPAETCLEQARRLLGRAGGTDWRIAWHHGLLALVSERIDEAERQFGVVLGALPGEDAPKIALGCCAEQRGRPAESRRYLEAVWRRDRSQVSAAFGLARAHLAEGDRVSAVEVLDAVPGVARHSDAARIAAVRIQAGRFPDRLPTRDELLDAAGRIPRLYLDGGRSEGASRDRLIAEVRELALNVAAETGRAGPAGDDPVLGDLTERTLRFRLEDSFRGRLAPQARSVEDHDVLVDLANAVRPRTLW